MQLLLTLGPHNEAVPRLEELLGALGDVHVLHGLACLHTMLPDDDLEVSVLDVAEGSRLLTLYSLKWEFVDSQNKAT